jgi:hypothetical protein
MTQADRRPGHNSRKASTSSAFILSRARQTGSRLPFATLLGDSSSAGAVRRPLGPGQPETERSRENSQRDCPQPSASRSNVRHGIVSFLLPTLEIKPGIGVHSTRRGSHPSSWPHPLAAPQDQSWRDCESAPAVRSSEPAQCFTYRGKLPADGGHLRAPVGVVTRNEVV